MEYIKLGQTDLTVSRLCLGGLSFGEIIAGGHPWLLDQAASTGMIAHVLDRGVNFIDTANKYAAGTSELFIGRALRALHVPRERVVLATKVYYNLTTEEHLTKKAILAEVEGSLRRLQTDYIDLYQIHRFDSATPIEETMEALDKLVREGKVRYLGASSMYGYQFHNMMLAAERNGFAPFCTMQNHYNLLYREDERELIPVCRQYGVSLIPYSPLASGHLARPLSSDATARSSTDRIAARRYDQTLADDAPIIDKTADIAREHQVPMCAVALAWLLRRGVAAPIVGATKVSHFDDALKALDLQLSDEEMAALEAPYRPHPVSGAL